ncbi:hypothetical protein RB195_003766 [Necator americanus]|uniref:Uncharacterized protein n=1 Tax=Necator americanus TaxID=51031 RepID=A0ABR1DQ19_NECAM
MATKAIHGNSQFQMSSYLRWTWDSFGGGYHTEIDHIIVSRRLWLVGVAVVPKCYRGPNHRVLRERTPFTRREQKAAKFRERSPRTTVDWDLFATLAGSWEDSMDRIDDECDQVVEHLRDCTRRAQSSKNFKRRLLLETLDLLQ